MLSPEQLERADSEVIVVSDGTGDTATSAVKAVMLQFHSEWKLRVFGGIRHESEVRRVIDQAEGSNALANVFESASPIEGLGSITGFWFLDVFALMNVVLVFALLVGTTVKDMSSSSSSSKDE